MSHAAVGLGVVILIVTILAVGYGAGHNAGMKRYATFLEAQNDTLTERQATITRLDRELTLKEAAHEKERAELNAKADAMRSRLAAIDRLRVKPQAHVPTLAATTAPSASDDTAPTLELYGQAGQDLIRLAYDADQVAISLKLCQNYTTAIQPEK